MGIRTNDFITFNADNNPFSIEFDGTTATFKIGATSIQTMTASGITHSSGLTETFNSPLNVGVNGTGHDVQFFGDTSGKKFFWDQSADTLFLPCTVDIDGTVTVGVSDTGYDVQFFGATAAMNMLWDESADSLLITSAAATALAVGLAGGTNPAFVVDSSTGSQAAGLKITGATAAGNVAAAVISSGAAANLLIDAKGTGTIGIGSVSTGAVTITPATTVTGAITATGGVKLAPVAIADATTYAVLTADSGKLHAVPDVASSITVTLPAAASGLTYEFMYSGAAADAQNHVFVPTAGFFIGNVTFHDSQADATTAVFSNGSSNDVFTLVTPAAYTLKFVSNGTNWYVTGHVQSATVCTMADS